jgi:nitrate reductase gamma subunit
VLAEQLLEFLNMNYVLIARWTAIAIFIVGVVYQIWVKWALRRPTAYMLKKIGRVSPLRYRVVTEFFRTLITNIALQLFIVRRNPLRWLMHFFIFLGGVVFVFFHAFPLMFGYSKWELFIGALNPRTWIYHYIFLGVILAGVMIAAIRRVYRSEAPEELDRYNLLPIILIAIILISGLIAAIVLQELYQIAGWTAWELECFKILHLVAAYTTLAIFPFTKFFHFFIRWIAISANLYLSYEPMEPQRVCINCGKGFASEARMQELTSIVGELQEGWLLQYCPECRRLINSKLDRSAPSITRPQAT